MFLVILSYSFAIDELIPNRSLVVITRYLCFIHQVAGHNVDIAPTYHPSLMLERSSIDAFCRTDA